MKYENVYRPYYALCAWGGTQPGQRPRTALFVVTQHARRGDRKLASVRARRVDIDSGAFLTKHDTRIAARDVLKSFGYYSPTPAALRAAKRALPVVECSHHSQRKNDRRPGEECDRVFCEVCDEELTGQPNHFYDTALPA